jgi:F-type H+-transporting ATPase subunit b|tara:strand:- start:637 stop:1212 length:576 start_codon:yes stop_codon:yes gene_type:complete
MRLFLLSIGILITSNTSLLAAEAGMPQLDPTYWASQAFWLVLIFTALYLALSNLFIPKIKDNIDSRENKIKDDLDEAQKLKNLADKKLEEYDQTIEDAKKEVQKIIFENKNELNLQIQSKKKEFDKEIENEIKAAEREIKDLKKDSLKNISIISEEIASKVIEQISGEPMNQSSVKAAILEASKKNLGKYI